MKLDREKFFAAALAIGAVTGGCSKDSPEAVSDQAAARPTPVVVHPPNREGVAPPSKEGGVTAPPPNREGMPPPPAREGGIPHPKK